MNKILLIFISLFISFPVCSQPGSFEIKPITQNIFVYTTWKNINNKPFPSNSMFIVGAKGIVILDTPWDTTQTFALIDHIEKQYQKKVIACIVTHFHEDRTAGLDQLRSRNIPSWSSSLTKYYCLNRNEQFADRVFEKDTLFRFDDIEFSTFYPGPGHSPDNILIYLKKEKLLYAGCFAKSNENSGLGNIADADLVLWENSIKKTIKKFKHPKYVIPGHYGWEKGALRHTLQLIQAK